MEAKFIDNGTEVEFILGQEIAEIHGNFLNKPIIGQIGGLMGHFFIVFSVLKQLGLSSDGEFWKK